jgi:GTPase
MSMNDLRAGKERAFLVGLELAGKPGALDVEASLEELSMLADTAGLSVAGQTAQRLRHPDPATYIGSGKVEEVRTWVSELDANIVIFDDELSPRHQRELEKSFGDSIRVIDRTALILDIFALHASTREGSLQVALAQYDYRLPRLTRQWTHLARQAGGGGARGGSAGVGLRGPGETQLETDRREIRRRMTHLKSELESVRAHRERYRAQRRRSGTPVIALVGYTNAGKSTLLNRLSGADVYVANQLFATLDPTTRRVSLPAGREILLTDTVGFIQKLPHSLVAAFRATLEEIEEATMILHVVDASNPYASEHIEVVKRTLREDLNTGNIPIQLVLNKVDQVSSEDEQETLDELKALYPDALAISARDGIGTSELLGRIEARLSELLVPVVVRLPYSKGSLVSWFHEVGIVEKEVHLEEEVEITGVIGKEYMDRFAAYIWPSIGIKGDED